MNLAEDRVRRRIALLTFDAVGPGLTGSAVRALELARALAGTGHQATLFTPSLENGGEGYPFPIRTFDPHAARETLLPLLRDAEAIVLPLYGLVRIPALASSRAPLVFDLYDPFVFELLTARDERGLQERRREILAHCSIVNHVLRRGDFFLCASERQRDMWLGALVANGRVIPSAGGDACFRHLIDVVPIGLSDVAPVDTPCEDAPLRSLLPVSPDDTLIISGGRLWDWQDPVTAVRAIGRVASHRRDVHLVFLAGTPPGHSEPPTAAAKSARDAARELGVLGRQAHFVERWIPYDQRGHYLRECDAGVTTHRSSIESHFSYRTRVLDYLWAGLPVICTAGDVLAELIARRELGAVVRDQDDGELATVFERIADDRGFVEACRTNIAAVRPSLAWRAAVEPLVRYCENPNAADRGPRGAAALRELAASAWQVLRAEGLRGAARRVHRHVFLRV